MEEDELEGSKGCALEEASSSSSTSWLSSVAKSQTLLGSDELNKHLVERRAVVQLTTWNMGSLPLPDEHQLRKIFYHGDIIQAVDVHVVAIQECWPDADALELQMQMCLCPQFALFHSVSFGTLHLSIFLRRDLLWFTTESVEISQTLRSGRLFKTKGFIAVGFGLFGSRFLFINAHLSAGDDSDRESQRAEELKRVIGIAKGNMSNSSSYDATFLCGDLNFRISRLKRSTILQELKNDNLDALLKDDQLNNLLRNVEMTKSSLNGFQEAATISFRPTYKYDLGTDNFDSSSKKRSPAYTDRIIYKCKSLPSNEPLVSCLSYESVKDLKTSDHRPVYAIFNVIVRPGFDTLPLTGAQFKRDVFVKAVQQRAKFLLDRRKKIASSACSVM
ncbi:unnamed protein product [Orchesella dallaii]|uniref:Inositol polyphosphate-related phosphatase domain-containing protein n=1 Tax=Orchesella dallaii TaxID=48710 RepID=A0ABP1QH62_9HEXA